MSITGGCQTLRMLSHCKAEGVPEDTWEQGSGPRQPCASPESPANSGQVAELFPNVSHVMPLTTFQQGAQSAISHF